MDSDFWSRAWESGKTGFHKSDVNPVLTEFSDRLLGDGPQRVFVPLCGQSVDMLWLVEQGHHVVGVELVESAVAGFFDLHRLPVTRTSHGPFTRWKSGALEVLQGDIFDLAENPLEEGVTAVWDRAAMVALRPERRPEYAKLILDRVCAPDSRILLHVFEYDPNELSGPPFSVPAPEVRSLFAEHSLEQLAERDGAAMMSRPDRPLSRFDLHTWLVQLQA